MKVIHKTRQQSILGMLSFLGQLMQLSILTCSWNTSFGLPFYSLEHVENQRNNVVLKV